MTSGIIFDIKRYAINDGPGIRTAIFLKGCPLQCWWCHNPEGQSSEPQLMVRTNRCNASKECIHACPQKAIHWQNEAITDWEACDHCGICVDVCYSGAREMVGRSVSVNQIIQEVERDIPFYDQSGGGVTFTGGEPMFQRDFLLETLMACKNLGIQAVVDTSGCAPWEGFEPIYPFVDLFLYDVKLIDEFKHIKYTSMSNKVILENLRRLSELKSHIIVRIPLIPGVNDGEDMEQAASFLAELPSLDGIELMPYHEIGLAKYPALGMNYKLKDIQLPTSQRIAEIEEIFSHYHLPVKMQFSRRTVWA